MGIDILILEGRALADIRDEKELRDSYQDWCSKVRVFIKDAGFSEKDQESVKVKMHYAEIEYSGNDTVLSLKKSLRDTIERLNEIQAVSKRGIEQEEPQVIERILENFYMYYHAMYKNPIHKRGTLTRQALDAIQIGNEYDLQRMLYAILLPLFPTARQEVYKDNGYGGMRADIYLDICNAIIEIKCTRESMTEKRLAEELGADGFHYDTDILYFFVYDKIGILKNPEAFRKAFVREREKDGKTIKMFIIQPVQL